MNQKIAISELLESAGSINDDDLLLLSKKISGNNFKSTKLAGSVFKEIVNGLISGKSSDFHRVAFPDWDDSKKVEITTNPWTVSGNGWVAISYKNTGNTDNVGIKINNILVAGFFRGENTWQDIQPAVIPVCDGDEIIFDTEYSGEITSLLEMYFYPIKLVTEHGIIGNGGSGGVIDGTAYTLSNNLTYRLNENVIFAQADTAYELYTVENDCALYVECMEGQTLAGGTADIGCKYWLDQAKTKPIYKHTDSAYGGSQGNGGAQGSLIPLKAGSKIYGSSLRYVGNSHPRSFKFIEYKLTSLNPQIAMPDYSVTPDDISTQVKSTDGCTITKNGWISVLYTAPDSAFDIEINGNTICNISTGFSIDMSLIPVSKNDIIKAVLRPGSSDVYATFNFYPAKAVVQTNDDSEEIKIIAYSESNGYWWKVYSNGYCEQGGTVNESSLTTTDTGSNGVDGNRTYNSVIPLPIEFKRVLSYTACDNGSLRLVYGLDPQINSTTNNYDKLSWYHQSISNYSLTCGVRFTIQGKLRGSTLDAIKNGTYTFFPANT